MRIKHPTLGSRDVPDESFAIWQRAGWKEDKPQASGGDVEKASDDDSGKRKRRARKPRSEE